MAGAEQIFGDEGLEDLRYLHVVLAQCGLPYREIPEHIQSYQKVNGRTTLIMGKGFAYDPKSREVVLQRIPFGVKPRVLLLHLCTLATKQQNAVIEIPPSMSGLMRDLGIGVTGGAKGTVAGFKEQLQRLAATRMQLLVRDEKRVSMKNPAPAISQFDVWFADENGGSKMLWPSTVTLSPEFFSSLMDGHSVPLDNRAIRALQQSAMALDIYTWLAHRLCRVPENKPAVISWEALKQQFGPEYERERKFKEVFSAALKTVLTVYPDANISDVGASVELRFSHPPVRRMVSRATNKGLST